MPAAAKNLVNSYRLRTNFRHSCLRMRLVCYEYAGMWKICFHYKDQRKLLICVPKDGNPAGVKATLGYWELSSFGRSIFGLGDLITVIGACRVKFRTVSEGSLICWLLVAPWTAPPAPAPAAAPIAAP